MPSEEINMNIFKLDTTQMLSIPGNLSQIAVMPNAVWGIAPDSSVWVFVGTNNPLPPTPQFQNVPGTLASIAVGGDGSVWGIAPDSSVWRFTAGGQFQNVPGKLASIAVGADGSVWGLSSDSRIWQFTGGKFQNVPGTLASIAVGNANAVWGIAPDSSVWQFTGGKFQNVPGTLASIAVGGDGSVWGLAQPPPTTQLDFDWPSITFGNGVPVGGNAHLTIHSDGTYTFSGHFHDSGATQYNMQLVWVVKDSTNTAYTFEHQGQVFGTFESGSRDDDWNNSGQNDEIKQNWANIVAGQTWKANADANGDLTNLLTTALAAVGVVLSVVGIVVSVVVVPPHP